MAGKARFTTVLSRKTTIDTMIATTMTRLVGAASRTFTFDPAGTRRGRIRSRGKLAPRSSKPHDASNGRNGGGVHPSDIWLNRLDHRCRGWPLHSVHQSCADRTAARRHIKGSAGQPIPGRGRHRSCALPRIHPLGVDLQR